MDSSARNLELGGYALWTIGSLLFAVVAFRNGDVISLVAGVMFLVGSIAMSLPAVQATRNRRRERRHWRAAHERRSSTRWRPRSTRRAPRPHANTDIEG